MTAGENGYEFATYEESELERARLFQAMAQQQAVARAAKENRLVVTPGMPPTEQIFAGAMHAQQLIMNSLTLVMLWQMQEVRKQMLALTAPAKAVLQ